ncbi:MAG: lactate utilization protein B [Gammaproteobacteria bacterium]|jgi:L-lactate dehydrogenase complex protein LldF
MSRQALDIFASELDATVLQAIDIGARSGVEKRLATLTQDYEDPDALRRLAGQLRQHSLDHLDEYLAGAERRLEENGAQVHFAATTARALEIVLDIVRASGTRVVTKSKSMASEELDLSRELASRGFEPLETDLGEFVVQLDDDHPSHIVKPIIHKTRHDVARSFERSGLGDYNDDPETITRRARSFMRDKFLAAGVTITGANFVSAESGRVVVVTNEGNARFGQAGADVHIVLAGIEKVIPRDRDLALLLSLLIRSATGQRITSYVELIGGPRHPAQPSGPREMHVIFMDANRSDIVGSDMAPILRCIRCGACMNSCPVYRESSGHAYRGVYPGPMGAVLGPLLADEGFGKLADLARASTLCGACHDVCPVDIPIPDLIARLRERSVREKVKHANQGVPPMSVYSLVARHPRLWRLVMSLGHLMERLPLARLPIAAGRAWLDHRTLPRWRGGRFRRWLRRSEKGRADD